MSFFEIDGPVSRLWADAMNDPWLGVPPWVIAQRAPYSRIVREARGLEAQAAHKVDVGHDYSARSLQKWADCCWLWAFIAWAEGRA